MLEQAQAFISWVDHFSGLNAKADDEFLEQTVEEHLDSQKREGNDECREEFVDVLLGIYKDIKTTTGFSIGRDSIKALILDIMAGGTDTTYTVLEWAMTELLRHPKATKQVQNEVRNIGRDKSYITDQHDFEDMHYLKAVIKESLRLYPTLVPRVARQEVKIMGYDIAAGTMVIINAWAIGRDRWLWDEPEGFRPQRFLNSRIDFKGQDFQLISFGAGRRGCPGISVDSLIMC